MKSWAAQRNLNFLEPYVRSLELVNSLNVTVQGTDCGFCIALAHYFLFLSSPLIPAAFHYARLYSSFGLKNGYPPHCSALAMLSCSHHLDGRGAIVRHRAPFSLFPFSVCAYVCVP